MLDFGLGGKALPSCGKCARAPTSRSDLWLFSILNRWGLGFLLGSLTSFFALRWVSPIPFLQFAIPNSRIHGKNNAGVSFSTITPSQKHAKSRRRDLA